nr:hypothetical protein [Tanacetum cinerariifolium]
MVDKADELIIQDTLQVSLAEHKSRQEQEARENVALVEEHLAYVEIEKMVEGQENVVDDSSIPKNVEHNIPGTRLEPRSYKESLEVEFTDVVIPVNVYDEEEEEDKITNEVYELKRMEKGKNVEESRITPFPIPIRSPKIHSDLVSLDTEKLWELTVTTSSSSSPNTKLSNTNRLLSLFKAIPARFKRYKSFFYELQGRYGYLFEHLKAKFMPRMSFVTLADHLYKEWLTHYLLWSTSILKSKFNSKFLSRIEIKFHYMLRKEEEEDKITNEVYELKRREKGKNVEESRITPFPIPIRSPKIHSDLHIKEQVQQQVPEQDRNQVPLYVTEGFILERKKNKEEMEKMIAKAILQEPKLKEITDEMLRQRCTLGDEHQYHIAQMKNFLKSDIVWEIQKEILVSLHPRKTTPLVLRCQRDLEAPTLSLINQDLLYIKKGNSGPENIVLSLHKFPAVVFNDDDIKERTFNGVLKGLKSYNNDVKYGYIQRDLTKDEVEYLKLFEEEIEDRLKYRRQMRRWESVLEGLKSYNNDVKYGYIQRDLTKDEVEYLKLFEEEMEDRLKYRRQMRRWESYVNERQLGLRREHLE